MPAPADLTVLLQRAHAGDAQSANEAYAALYPELLKIARARLRVHQAPTLLDTQALVHESFLRFVGGAAVALQSRKHFYAYAAKAMRHIVIDFVRRSQAERRDQAAQGDQEPEIAGVGGRSHASARTAARRALSPLGG